jgi:hypothetical protein
MTHHYIIIRMLSLLPSFDRWRLMGEASGVVEPCEYYMYQLSCLRFIYYGKGKAVEPPFRLPRFIRESFTPCLRPPGLSPIWAALENLTNFFSPSRIESLAFGSSCYPPYEGLFIIA